jgi:hypothetical protein
MQIPLLCFSRHADFRFESALVDALLQFIFEVVKTPDVLHWLFLPLVISRTPSQDHGVYDFATNQDPPDAHSSIFKTVWST